MRHRGTLITDAMVLATLLLLLAISILASRYSLGIWSSIVALGIAAMKAGLIVWYFMHLRDETTMIRLFAVAGLSGLAVMLLLLTADYRDRKPASSADTLTSYGTSSVTRQVN